MKKLVAVAVAGLMMSGVAQATYFVAGQGRILETRGGGYLQAQYVKLDMAENHQCGSKWFVLWPNTNATFDVVFNTIRELATDGVLLTAWANTDNVQCSTMPDEYATNEQVLMMFKFDTSYPATGASGPLEVVVTNPVDVNVLTAPSSTDTECVRYETSGMLAKTGVVVANTVCAEWR